MGSERCDRKDTRDPMVRTDRPEISSHQFLLLNGADHDGSSLRVGREVLPWNYASATCLPEGFNMDRLELQRNRKAA